MVIGTWMSFIKNTAERILTNLPCWAMSHHISGRLKAYFLFPRLWINYSFVIKRFIHPYLSSSTTSHSLILYFNGFLFLFSYHSQSGASSHGMKNAGKTCVGWNKKALHPFQRLRRHLWLAKQNLIHPRLRDDVGGGRVSPESCSNGKTMTASPSR